MVTGAKKTLTRGSPAKTAAGSVRVDPKLTSALNDGNDGQKYVVILKLDSKNLNFSRYAVSNRPNSPRERAFREDVNIAVRNVAPDQETEARILQAAANLGVATLEAPREVLKQLTKSPYITRMKLKSS